jgi:Kdo2-lipid IVA lauroyltransferase/acyltransferase
MKKMRYIGEHLFLLILHGICRIMPWTWASKIFGITAACLGSRMAINRKAMRHIMAALVCNEEKARVIAKGHWNNLGRVMAEYPHLKTIATHHVTFRGLEHLIRLRDDGKGGILFGAHLGNWEVIPHALLHHTGLAMHPVYRAPNNPYVDKRLHAYRAPKGSLTPYSKSRQGMVGMVKALKSGEHLGLLIDQKYNEGVEANFFGIPAMTGTAFIELAIKYDCPLVPIRCIRENNGFIIEACTPIATKNREVMDVLNDAHALLEKWIKQYPDQWLWLHRRWKNKDL